MFIFPCTPSLAGHALRIFAFLAPGACIPMSLYQKPWTEIFRLLCWVLLMWGERRNFQDTFPTLSTKYFSTPSPTPSLSPRHPLSHPSLLINRESLFIRAPSMMWQPKSVLTQRPCTCSVDSGRMDSFPFLYPALYHLDKGFTKV